MTSHIPGMKMVFGQNERSGGFLLGDPKRPKVNGLWKWTILKSKSGRLLGANGIVSREYTSMWTLLLRTVHFGPESSGPSSMGDLGNRWQKGHRWPVSQSSTQNPTRKVDHPFSEGRILLMTYELNYLNFEIESMTVLLHQKVFEIFRLIFHNLRLFLFRRHFCYFWRNVTHHVMPFFHYFCHVTYLSLVTMKMTILSHFCHFLVLSNRCWWHFEWNYQ